MLVAVASPKFHRYVKGSPSGSAVPADENAHVRTEHEGVPITGTGAALPAGWAIVIVLVVVAASPHASVTVRVTV